jgi:hypothetical protein
MAYSNPVTAIYRFPAAALSTAGIVGRIVGPMGKKGVVASIGSVVTTSVTVAAANLSITDLSGDVVYATASVPVSSANAVRNTFASVQNHEVEQDAVVLVSTDGGSTAGAADLLVGIDWY